MGIQVADYISELLFEHDCVIIPGLGGFIANYQEASIDHGQGDILPPSKSLSFNPDLQINDGLLINHITRKEHISYAEARNAVEQYAKFCKKTLDSGEILALPSVGKLYKDIEHKLRFIPDSTNFLMDSFGLPKVQFFPILRAETTEEKIAIIEESVEKPIPVSSRSGKKGIVWFPLAATAGVVLLFLLMIPLIRSLTSISSSTNQAGIEKPMKERERDKGLAGLIDTGIINDGSNTGLDDISEESETALDNPATDEHLAENNTTATEEDTTVPETTNTEDLAEVEPEPSTPETDPGDVSPSSEGKSYIIVVGCFSVKENAEKLADKIRNDGYTVDVGKWGKLNRVGVEVNGSRAMLREIHQEVKDQYTESAWVLNR